MAHERSGFFGKNGRTLFDKEGLSRFTDTGRELLILYAFLVLVSSTIYSLAEDAQFGDSLWWAVVTSTTVGYGDFFPVTTMGRVAGGLLVMGTVFVLIPLITARIASALIVDENAFTHEEQEEMLSGIREIRRIAVDDRDTTRQLAEVFVGEGRRDP